MSDGEHASVSDRTQNEEVFFALVGPVGTNLSAVIDALAKELGALNYETTTIKMSGLLDELHRESEVLEELPEGPEDARIEARMDAGDALRKRLRTASALAVIAAMFVRRVRVKQNAKHAFIFDSLKHPDELSTLRQLYGDALFCVSVFSPKATRILRLAQRIAQSKQCNREHCEEIAKTLVERDEHGGDREYGQDVRGIFPLADAFVQEGADMHSQLARIVELLFGNAFRTPSRDELGMFHARAAALRSSDLSRQVGAALSDEFGSLLAAGCNEVPKAGGGTFWDGDRPDSRDFQYGRDPNVEHKYDALKEVFERLKERGWLSDEKGKLEGNELASLATKRGGPLSGTRVDSLIEFGRVVHAEMNALMDAAMRGVAVRGCTLYCTTLPCHNCGRHLIAAGVKRVVYIEPYPKSLTDRLYPDMVHMRGVESTRCADTSVLSFDPFVGVAPRRFISLFEMGDIARKTKDGFVKHWNPSGATPRFRQVFANHEHRELSFILELRGVLESELKINYG